VPASIATNLAHFFYTMIKTHEKIAKNLCFTPPSVDRSCASDLSSRPLKQHRQLRWRQSHGVVGCLWPARCERVPWEIPPGHARWYAALTAARRVDYLTLNTPAHGKLLPTRGSYRRCSFPPATLCDFAIQTAPVKNLVGIDAVPLRDTGHRSARFQRLLHDPALACPHSAGDLCST
jgi:hypothetical protein